MHDVLDPRDQVPDEAEQLLHSGYPVNELLAVARKMAAVSDSHSLEKLNEKLKSVPRSADWPYDEPSDTDSLLTIIKELPRIAVGEANITDRIHGAWLGRSVGNTLGKPVEGLTRQEVEIYLKAVGQWPQTGYIPLLEPLPEGVTHLHESSSFSAAGRFADAPRDDDVDWTILGLWLLEEYGHELTTEQIAAAWLDRLPFTQTFTAERVVYRNLVSGIPPHEAASVDNPYREWIGALIRADIFGFINPGDPAEAARLALVDARLSHEANGIYGEIWDAALVAAALVFDDALAALKAALPSIPRTSRLAESQLEMLALHERGVSADEALAWIDKHLGHYNWVHTVNNAAIITLGLLWGTDFTSSVTLAISAGRDTDSTAASVGSIYGALHGSASIPADLVGTTHVHIRSAVRDFDRVTIAELAERTLNLIPQNREIQ